jgi:hypothetical protein
MSSERKTSFRVATNKRDARKIYEQLGITEKEIAETKIRVEQARKNKHKDRMSLPQVILFLLRANLRLITQWLRTFIRAK